MLLTACIKLQTRFLGSKKPNINGVRQINLNPDGMPIIYMSTFWKGLNDAAEELGIKNLNRDSVQLVNYLRTEPKTKITNYTYMCSSRSPEKPSVVEFECYPAGARLFLDCKIDTRRISIRGFTSILELCGAYHGLSQFGSRWGYGRFTVESVTNSTIITSSESTIMANNPNDTDSDIILSNCKNPNLLNFGAGNAKLDGSIATFALPAGYTCPFAKDCLNKVVENPNGEGLTIEAGKHAKFRCYAASLELIRKTVRESEWKNFNLLRNKSLTETVKLLDASLDLVHAKYVRLHTSGDFFSEDYFKAWMKVARKRPSQLFYCYTKALPFWVKNKKIVPPNMIITASYGGKWDSLIDKYRLKSAKVYFHPEDAEKDGVLIDHDDSLAKDPKVKKFGILLHGLQPKGSKASEALKRMNKEKIKYSYSQP